MQKIILWFQSRENWDSIGHNLVANGIVAVLVVIPSAALMLWSYLIGQSGPWIIITGIFAAGGVLWLRSNWMRRSTYAGAHDKIADSLAKEHAERERKAERVTQIRATLLAHVDSAPRPFEYGEAGAWIAATDNLLRDLRIRAFPRPFNREPSVEDQKKNFQKAIAHVRAAAANFCEKDVK